MRVLNVSALYDAAGDGIRTKQAFDACAPGWRYHATHRRETRWQYPSDIPWTRAKRVWFASDVIHAQLGFEAESLLRVPRRPTVVHHHGSIFRRDRDRLLREQHARHARAVVSTLDLYLMARDDVEWSPSPYDLDWLATLRRPVDDGILRIAHAPTNRAIKSTEAFLAATERLAREVPLEVILVERMPWRLCLARKASADIYFDQVTLGYGCNAIESWGMGIPVVAGAAPATLAEIAHRAGGLPFVPADESTIYEALRSLVEPSQRAQWAAIGSSFARRFHDQAAVVANLQRIFGEVAR